MDRVLVLMSTYNGEKYISEQLDSILNQKEVDVNILIRDDGSIDKTVRIIEKFQLYYPSKIILVEGKNIGWKRSFFDLIKIAYTDFSDYMYYAFSDQDDIWKEQKLKIAISFLLHEPLTPQLYCSNLDYFKDGNTYGLINKIYPFISYKTCLIRNFGTGCTIVFNHELLALLNKKFPSIDIAHDYWTFLVAKLCGTVFYDHNSYILYRQHENNQIGSKRGWKEKWKRRYKELGTIIYGHIKERIAQELYALYSTDMNPEAKDSVLKIAQYRKSLINRIDLIKDSGYSSGVRASDRILKFKILFGLI